MNGATPFNEDRSHRAQTKTRGDKTKQKENSNKNKKSEDDNCTKNKAVLWTVHPLISISVANGAKLGL